MSAKVILVILALATSQVTASQVKCGVLATNCVFDPLSGLLDHSSVVKITPLVFCPRTHTLWVTEKSGVAFGCCNPKPKYPSETPEETTTATPTVLPTPAPTTAPSTVPTTDAPKSTTRRSWLPTRPSWLTRPGWLTKPTKPSWMPDLELPWQHDKTKTDNGKNENKS